MRSPAYEFRRPPQALFGFLIGALLLVAMGVLSLLVIRQMNDRMEELNHAQVKATRAQDMLYAVTAQSHYRAMALLPRQRCSSMCNVEGRGGQEDIRPSSWIRWSSPSRITPTSTTMSRTINEEYTASGHEVLARFENK